MNEYTYLEYLAADLLTYVPFILLFLYAFKNNYRFNKYITFVILALLTVMYLICNHIFSSYDDWTMHISTYAMTALCVIAALTAIKANFGRIVFIALFLKNCADYVVVISKYIEHLIWPEEAMEIYNWTYALTIAAFELFFVSGLFIVIRKHFVLDEVGEFYSRSWRYLWVVPLFFYYTWIYLYYSDGSSSLESALHGGNSILLTLSIICQLLIYICLVRLVNNANEKVLLKEQLHIYDLQTLQNKNISLQIERSSRMRHDIRHHALTIRSFAEEKNYPELIKYLNGYIDTIDNFSTIKYCKNRILNTLLAHYGERCREEKIGYDVKLNIPEDIPLSDTDTSILFGNLIENAYEACNRQAKEENRYIFIRGKLVHNQLAFTIQNSVAENCIFENSETIPSSKRSGHGIGTKSCKHIISKVSGNIRFGCEEGVFKVNLMIPY